MNFKIKAFCCRIRNTLLYVSLELSNPYITRFLAKTTNTTFYYLFPQGAQKGEQKTHNILMSSAGK